MTTLLLVVVIVVVVTGVVLVWMFRPGLTRDDTPHRHELVAAMVNRPGGDTLDPFAHRVDKVHYLDPETGGVVAYRPRFGVALASGCPLLPVERGDEEDDIERTLAGFLSHCRARRLRPAIIGLDPVSAAAAARLGLRTIYVGDEALVRTEGFRLDQPAMRNVRQANQRTSNFGVTAEVAREGDLPADVCRTLSEIGGDALGPDPERGFSMTHSDVELGHRPHCVIVMCRDREGELIAYQRYSPTQGDRTLSLDVMRRRPEAPNGVNERMIVEAIRWSEAQGFERVSLNFATFKTLMDLGEDRNLIQRIEYRMVHLLDRWIQVESLYRFNAKFHPEWLGRHVAFRSYLDLPSVLVAALVAEFGVAGTARLAQRVPVTPQPAAVQSAGPQSVAGAGAAGERRPSVNHSATASSMSRTTNPNNPSSVDPPSPPR